MQVMKKEGKKVNTVNGPLWIHEGEELQFSGRHNTWSFIGILHIYEARIGHKISVNPLLARRLSRSVELL